MDREDNIKRRSGEMEEEQKQLPETVASYCQDEWHIAWTIRQDAQLEQGPYIHVGSWVQSTH